MIKNTFIRFQFGMGQKFILNQAFSLQSNKIKIRKILREEIPAELSNITICLYYLTHQTKKLNQPLPLLFNEKEKNQLQNLITQKIKDATSRDLQFIQYSLGQYPNFYDKDFVVYIQQEVKKHIMSDQFTINCPQGQNFASLFFYTAKIKQFPQSDNIWLRFLKLILHYETQLNPHDLGLILWCLSSLKIHQKNDEKMIQKIEEIWQLFQDQTIEQIDEKINLYSLCLIMQSFAHLKKGSINQWLKLIKLFNQIYIKEYDSYSFVYCLWAIAQASKFHRKFYDFYILLVLDINQLLDVKNLEQYIQKNIDLLNYKQKKSFLQFFYSQNYFLNLLWSLEKLHIGDQQFWTIIYVQQLRPTLMTRKINLNQIALIVLLGSRLNLLNEQDWKLSQEIILKGFENSNDLFNIEKFNEKSLISILNTFTCHLQGDSQFWLRIQQVVNKNINQINGENLVKILFNYANEEVIQKIEMKSIEKILNQVINRTKELRLKDISLLFITCTKIQLSAVMSNKLFLNVNQCLNQGVIQQGQIRDLCEIIYTFEKLKVWPNLDTTLLILNQLNLLSKNQIFKQVDFTQILYGLKNLSVQNQQIYQSSKEIIFRVIDKNNTLICLNTQNIFLEFPWNKEDKLLIDQFFGESTVSND